MLARWVWERVSAARERISRPPEPLVHVEWRRYVEAFHTVGLAQELDIQTLPARLGDPARGTPTSEDVSRLLDGYYRGDGDAEAGMRRTRADRYVTHHAGDRSTARQIVARLRLAVPEIGPLALVDEDARREPSSAISLRTFRRKAPLPRRELDSESFEHSGLLYVRRTITVRALVAATNALLASRGIARRFLPLDGTDELEAYVALEPGDAAVLDLVDAFAAPLDELRAFAGWGSSSSAIDPELEELIAPPARVA